MDNAGRVLVMDFGLARSVEMSGLTQTGTVLGTPAYMSPEQALGGVLDERSDLFSLGVIFYELLTGQVPFQADTVWGTLLKRTEGPPPPPTSIVCNLPAALSDIVMKGLAIDPAERFQTATELTLALDMWIGDGPFAGVTPPLTPRREPRAAAAVVAGIGSRRTRESMTLTPATPAAQSRLQILCPISVEWVLLIGTEGPEGGQMKRSAKVISFVLACAVTPAIVPQAVAQTQPANPGTPPAATQTPQQNQSKQQTQAKQQQNTQGPANRAKGAAAGAAIGAATGNAAGGAVIGAGHSRRQERRSNRHGQ
jgi:serine/threonine protein kinase